MKLIQAIEHWGAYPLTHPQAVQEIKKAIKRHRLCERFPNKSLRQIVRQLKAEKRKAKL